MGNDYTNINAKTIDAWVESGWEWGRPVDHDTFVRAKQGIWDVVLTPTKPVPKGWFCDFKDAEILGLASGGGQQIPIFSALGARCSVLDYSERQIESERMVAERECYSVALFRNDMTKRLPFDDNRFDLIFHPVSNCYIEDVFHVWKECHRVLKPNGILLAGLDNGLNFVFNDECTEIIESLPFNPLKDERLYKKCVDEDWGIQFSHGIEVQVGDQIRAGLTLTDIYEDTNGEGNLNKHNIPTFFATRSVKK